jgi:predicted nucleotidyltransferase
MAQAVKDIAAIRERDIKPILGQVTEVIRRHLPEPSVRILLFGSWATLTSVPTSDVDVGILGESPVAPLIMARIREGIEDLSTLRKVDIVDLRTVDGRLRDRVLQHAVMLGRWSRVRRSTPSIKRSGASRRCWQNLSHHHPRRRH